ncbi:tRNA pseudouridine(55) synthase TruB [Patescibacteria group bacterium]
MNEGFLLINKPTGMTSHDVVNKIRRITGVKRVGHAGTLDPFATGLLIVGVGRTATREMDKLVGLDKEYQAVFVLGAASDTDDRTGRVAGVAGVSVEGIETAIKKFTGAIEQIPPQYAAIKIKGKKMYELARQGLKVEAKPRSVVIYEYQLESPLIKDKQGQTIKIKVKVHCSSGTYIRALARDLGEALETGGYVEELHRSKIGPFDISEAVFLNEIENEWPKHLIINQDLLNRIEL